MSHFLSPLRGLFEFEVRVTHGFAPWAAFFRRFAAGFQTRSDQLLQIDVLRSTSPPCLAKIRRDKDGAPVVFVGLFRGGAFVMPGICLLAWVEYHVGSI